MIESNAPRTLKQPSENLGGPAGGRAVAAQHAPAKLAKRGGDPGSREGDNRPALPHPVGGYLHEPLPVAGAATLRQHGDTIDNSPANRHLPHKEGAGHNLGMPHDPPAEPGDEPVGRIMVGMVDGRVKLGA